MTYVLKPKFAHPSLPVNDLGLTRRDYEGSMSTLCAGCGHDSISVARRRRPPISSPSPTGSIPCMGGCRPLPRERISPTASWCT